MGGYEGHRGWIYYLGVAPEYQRQGLGKRIMDAIEARLIKIGCPKINILVRAGNAGALNFFQEIGYNTEEITSLGKRLIEDQTGKRQS